MSARLKPGASLRQRLRLQLLGLIAILSLLLYFSVRTIAGGAAETTQDNILSASATSIVEALHAEQDDILLDIPYAALSMLGANSEERVFYRILTAANTITGYDDLPAPETFPAPDQPVFYNSEYRGSAVRIVAMTRVITVMDTPTEVLALVAQTRLGQDAITARIANTAAALGVGFFLIAGILGALTVESALRPIENIAQAVQRRGPHDLRPMLKPAPSELAPLLASLNSFMERLRTALLRTEDFIAEAAHRVRTPLATVRAQTEIALRRAKTPEDRKALRAVIRAVDESARSAGQLLDHASVTLRADKMERVEVDLSALVKDLVHGLAPTADIRDIRIILHPAEGKFTTIGDPVLLMGALRNILDNAIKYSPDESEISVALTGEDEHCCITICDHGRGLDDAEQKTLTRRFERGSNVADVVGSGLGLTIVSEVVAAHGGSFRLTPNQERGTCAKVCLPQK